MCADWHNEWATAPDDPLPSNLSHLDLLNQPAKINMKNHAQNARRVSLIYYDVNMVPEGRVMQDLRREKEAEELRLTRDAENFVLEMERVERRHEVVKAARLAEVIDLTEDDMVDIRVSRNLPSNMAMRPPMNAQYDFTGLPRVAEAHQYPAFPFTAGRNQRLTKPPGTASAQLAARRLRPHNCHARKQHPTLFSQVPLNQKVPTYFTPHEFSKPAAFNTPTEYQVTCPHQPMGIWPSGLGFGTAGA